MTRSGMPDTLNLKQVLEIQVFFLGKLRQKNKKCILELPGMFVIEENFEENYSKVYNKNGDPISTEEDSALDVPHIWFTNEKEGQITLSADFAFIKATSLESVCHGCTRFEANYYITGANTWEGLEFDIEFEFDNGKIYLTAVDHKIVEVDYRPLADNKFPYTTTYYGWNRDDADGSNLYDRQEFVTHLVDSAKKNPELSIAEILNLEKVV